MTAGRDHNQRYGQAHRAERAKWVLIVDAGQGYCTAPLCLHRSRYIPPGSNWHLGHTADGLAYAGPQHEKCNTSDGGRRRHGPPRRKMVKTPAVKRWRPTRAWLRKR
jgi:hypothetical protein